MIEIPQVIFRGLTGILSAIGLVACIYCVYYIIFENRNRRDLHVKGNTYLILDIDEIGDKLEYYIRRIQTDINNRYIYISRIILYSKSLNTDDRNNTDVDVIENESIENEETLRLCKILTQDYSNIIFLGRDNNILDIFS